MLSESGLKIIVASSSLSTQQNYLRRGLAAVCSLLASSSSIQVSAPRCDPILLTEYLNIFRTSYYFIYLKRESDVLMSIWDLLTNLFSDFYLVTLVSGYLVTLALILLVTMTKNSAESQVAERRLRPIYDWLDTGNNKKALQEADKVLKKQPEFQCCKVLKCLALIRLGKEGEAETILTKVSAF